MMFAWIGLTLLSASWLFAVGFFGEPNLPLSWVVEYFGGSWDRSFDPPLWRWLLGLGTVCLALSRVSLPGGRSSASDGPQLAADRAPFLTVLPGPIVSLFGLLLCVPALFLLPWPHRAGPLLLTIGMALSFIVTLLYFRSDQGDDPYEPPPWVGRVLSRLTAATLLAGSVWLMQGLALEWYQAHTAYGHELPQPIPHVIGFVGRCLGIDAGVADSTIAIHSMRKIHLLGATWELLLDPASLCLLAGGLVLLAWRNWTTPAPRGRLVRWLVASCVLLLIFALWLPIRSGLYMALFLNDVLRIPYDSEIDSMRLFWDPLLHCLFLLPPLLLAWRFVPAVGEMSRRDDASGEGEAPAEPQRSNEEAPAEPTGDATTNGEEHDASAVPAAHNRLDDSHDLPADNPLHGRATRGASTFGVAAVIGCLLAAAGIALLTLAVVWHPVGEPRPSRVIVEEYHPNPDEVWEKTWTAMDTEWYGYMSGYNYYCLYQYLTHYYPMQRHRDGPLTDESLNDDDVLIIKVPTRPFSEPEVESIVSFVERGGGLMLIGEHTNYQRSSTFMNPIARRFGFEFNTDNVYNMRGFVYDIPHQPAIVPHPIVQHAPTLHFATPCSIRARPYSGSAAIRGMALKNLPADYHAYENFMPQPENRAETRYGTFTQLWATGHGKGRVVAFTDSTIFSNFSAFEPDTAELMLGMIEWLRRRPPQVNPRPWLLNLGGLLLVVGLQLTRPSRGGWILIVAVGLSCWSAVVIGTNGWQAQAMPLPAERADKSDLPEGSRDKVDVVFDRTVCQAPLPVSAFITGGTDSYGLFERWVLRLGYFPSRRDENTGDRDVFGEELLVFLNADQRPDDDFLKRLEEYVSSGGKVLVVESPLDDRQEPERAGGDQEGADGTLVLQRSFVNRLLEPFEMTVDHHQTAGGDLSAPADWPQVPVDEALLVAGGTPFVSVDGMPVGVFLRHGKGLVVVVGFGNRFVDDNMGYSDQTEPDEALREVFELQYRLFREMVQPTGPPFADEAGE